MLAATVRRSLPLAFLAAATALALAVGCAAPYKEKSSLPVCDEGDTSCSGGGNQETTKKGSSSSSNSSSSNNAPSDPDPAPSSTAPAPTTTADAGKDAAPPPQEPSCKDLDGCCQQLKDQGYDPSMCKGVVGTNNNLACYSSYQNYKNAGDCS